MATAWTLTAGDIVKSALELCQAQGVGETVSAEDNDVCLRSLNGILKELPIHGICWPKVSSSAVAVAWASGTPSRVTPPVDYFGAPSLDYTDQGNQVPVEHISKARYDAILNPAQTARYPTQFYVAPDRSFYLWPVPTVDPVLKLTYQAIISDATLTVTPDVQQAYLNGLTFWLANEIKLKFAPPGIWSALEKEFLNKRAMMIQWSVDTAPICIEVDGL